MFIYKQYFLNFTFVPLFLDIYPGKFNYATTNTNVKLYIPNSAQGHLST